MENWLVVSTPLKNISQLGLLFPIYGKNKTCSKPPTRKKHDDEPIIFLGYSKSSVPHRAPWTHHSLCACGPWVKMAKKFSPKSQGFHRLEKHGITMKKLRKHTIFSRFLVGAISL